MNSFIYKDTIIMESQLDFSRFEKGTSFSSEVSLSATISIPRDPEKNRKVICTIDLTFGSPSDVINLHVKSRSFFEIDGAIDAETLQKDAQEKCYPKAGECLTEKIAELTRLHIGSPLNIPIPQTF